ncbi:endonuclease Q family protein [Virgibacillus flavescens]|uniref:endonuclease Q family protein n=1 Tax=Virgibacillus flavescens TaxID=1611422 RepID=UPI003D34D0E7
MLQSFFADLHIHIGRDMYDKPVKITGSKSLTLTNILLESSRNKGIHMVGIIDCHTPHVQQELKQLLNNKQAIELDDGGIRFEKVTLILGSEIEVYDENCQGPIHVLCYLPTLAKMEEFTVWLATKMTNINLSSQRYYGSAKDLQYKVKELDGMFVPAHVFTPFKSTYGKGVKQSLEEVFDTDLIDAIELGLSSDTSMADQIEELHAYTFLSNSDAHSLGKIAREYQEIAMEEPSFKELNWAIHQVNDRRIIRNFGMNPQLGKYYATVCRKCLTPLNSSNQICSSCGSTKIVKGVADRIKELAGTGENNRKRPQYMYQVPLEYLPSLGRKTFTKLLEQFGTEMNIIHHVSVESLNDTVPVKVSQAIIQMRSGELSITAGGGGKYGSIDSPKQKY